MLSEHGLSAEMCDEEPATQPLNSQKEKLPSARRNFFLELPSVWQAISGTVLPMMQTCVKVQALAQ